MKLRLIHKISDEGVLKKIHNESEIILTVTKECSSIRVATKTRQSHAYHTRRSNIEKKTKLHREY